ncbi:LysR family transcriptional regulator [Anaerovorax odorimutans]|uniref:LysR family transcriptional regulator n=1 Tax=Anaerovorax odorimutans TaxID=109327 RepID=UPI000408D20B|nr:LysR family transcriptional regulator [Anaerovorax odorimutans]
MNINHLRYFLAVCEYGNITKAADKVHMSQPSVTAAIKYLENKYGFRLFTRSHNHVVLTEEGKEFLNLTKHLINECDDFESRALELGQQKDIILKIGMPAVLGSFFYKKIIPDFEIKNPGIHLKIEEVPTIAGTKHLEDSRLDLLIGITDKTTYANCDSSLIFKTELQLAVNSKSPLANCKSVTEDMLTDYPFVIISEGSYHYRIIMSRFECKPINIVLHSNQVSTIKYMLENDYAITIIYKEIFNDNPKICTIPLETPITANVNVFWRKGSYRTTAMKTFISYLCHIMSDSKKI